MEATESGASEMFSTTIFHLPVEDILVTHVGKYLNWKDLVNFGRCSSICEEIADKMFARLERVKINGFEDGCALKQGLMHYNCHFYFFSKLSTRLREIKLVNFPLCLKNEHISELISNKPLLQYFYIEDCSQVTLNALLPLAMNCKSLRHLHLPDILVDDDFITKLTENTKELKKVEFYDCVGLSRKVFEVFLENQPQMKSITMCDIIMSPCGLRWFLDAYPKRECFFISLTTLVSLRPEAYRNTCYSWLFVYNMVKQRMKP